MAGLSFVQVKVALGEPLKVTDTGAPPQTVTLGGWFIEGLGFTVTDHAGPVPLQLPIHAVTCPPPKSGISVGFWAMKLSVPLPC
ncbi:MAG: hypothetical protein EPGJADBJ_04941 [Saprospiraceae bacterium]|nr:hypothetical protein [Saprospiraceae bacterium]